VDGLAARPRALLSLAAQLERPGPLRLLCIGAHSDDLEIGCSGTVLSWLESPRELHVTWVVLAADGERAQEARRSAAALLRRAASAHVILGEFKDGFLPAQYETAKTFFETLKGRPTPDVILTHRLEDRHQDHRLASELTWNTWRDHLILEYEIPKYEGDLGQPNVFVPLRTATAKRKVAHLERHFGSQRSKDWFASDNFLALARLRGLECRAPSGFAEGFHARKLLLSPPRVSR
jgi:LmbE family N-acetylglucosaminyl deacetylase